MSICFEKDSRDLLSDLCEEYLAHCEMMLHRAPKTLKTNRYWLKCWERWCREFDIDSSRPTPLDIQMFSQRPVRQAGGGTKERSESSQRNSLFALRGFFGWLKDWKDFESDPSKKTVPVRKKQPRPKPVPFKEFFGLPFAKLDLRLQLALGLGFFTGIRRSEMALLRVGDVQDDFLIVNRPKTHDVSDFPWVQVSKYLAEDHDARGWSCSAFRDRWMRQMMERVRDGDVSESLIPNLTEGSHTLVEPEGEHVGYLFQNAFGYRDGLDFSPHQLRHSFGQNMANLRNRDHRPMPDQLAGLMGHRSIQTTIDYYYSALDSYVDGMNTDMSRKVS